MSDTPPTTAPATPTPPTPTGTGEYVVTAVTAVATAAIALILLAPVISDSDYSSAVNFIGAGTATYLTTYAVVDGEESRDHLMGLIGEVKNALSTDVSISSEKKTDILLVLVVFLAALYERKQVSPADQDQLTAAITRLPEGILKTRLTHISKIDVPRYNKSTTAMKTNGWSMIGGSIGGSALGAVAAYLKNKSDE
jgi:hypothetical protein